jgi:hypothetical protein
MMRLMDESVVGAAYGGESLEALDEDVLLLALMSSNSRRLESSKRCMSSSRRSTCTSRRRIMGCSWGTHSNSGG